MVTSIVVAIVVVASVVQCVEKCVDELPQFDKFSEISKLIFGKKRKFPKLPNFVFSQKYSENPPT